MCPGRGAARSGAPLIRDRRKLGVCNDPGSAAHHCVLRCARETRMAYDPAAPSAFSISGLMTVSRFSDVIGPTSL